MIQLVDLLVQRGDIRLVGYFSLVLLCFYLQLLYLFVLLLYQGINIAVYFLRPPFFRIR